MGAVRVARCGDDACGYIPTYVREVGMVITYPFGSR